MAMRTLVSNERLAGGGRFARYVAVRFFADDALRAAAALAYTSLLALVPLLAIGLALLAAFPAFDDVRGQLQQFVFENFAPDIGAAVQEHVAEFVARAGELTAAGVVGLGVAAVLLLVTVETALNEIFRVARPRPPLSRLFMYWTLITLGPLLVGTSLSLSGYVAAVEAWAAARGLPPGMLSQVLPTLLVVVAFALLYFAVPNRRVRLLDALIGGIFAALLFAGLRFGFGIYVANARVYQSLYGALAAVPLFLLWMFLTWAVVLLGAELTASLPEWRSGRRRPEAVPGPRRRLALALDVLAAAYRAGGRAGTPGVSRRELLHATAADEPAITAVARALLAAGFLARGEDGERLLLARDPETATVYDLLHALGLALADGSGDATPDGALIARLDVCQREALAVDLKTMLKRRTARHRKSAS